MRSLIDDMMLGRYTLIVTTDIRWQRKMPCHVRLSLTQELAVQAHVADGDKPAPFEARLCYLWGIFYCGLSPLLWNSLGSFRCMIRYVDQHKRWCRANQRIQPWLKMIISLWYPLVNSYQICIIRDAPSISIVLLWCPLLSLWLSIGNWNDFLI